MVGRRTFFFTDSYRIVGKSTPLTHTSLQRTHSFKINKFNSVLKLKLTWLRKYRHHANEEKEENKIHWILANGATTHYSHNTCQTRDNSFFFSPLIVWTIQLGFSPRVGLCFECHLFAIRLSVFGIHGNFVEKNAVNQTYVLIIWRFWCVCFISATVLRLIKFIHCALSMVVLFICSLSLSPSLSVFNSSSVSPPLSLFSTFSATCIIYCAKCYGSPSLLRLCACAWA